MENKDKSILSSRKTFPAGSFVAPAMDMTDIIQQVIKETKPLHNVIKSLEVPDSDITGYFLHDKAGQTADCNIYLGRQFETVESPVYTHPLANNRSYTHPISGQKSTSSYEWAILCQHENGSFTSKDGIEIFKEIVAFPQYRIATSEEDFELLYQRHWTDSQIKDESCFQETLSDHIASLDRNFKEYLTDEQRLKPGQPHESLFAFKRWLQNKKAANKLVPLGSSTINFENNTDRSKVEKRASEATTLLLFLYIQDGESLVNKHINKVVEVNNSTVKAVKIKFDNLQKRILGNGSPSQLKRYNELYEDLKDNEILIAAVKSRLNIT